MSVEWSLFLVKVNQEMPFFKSNPHFFFSFGKIWFPSERGTKGCVAPALHLTQELSGFQPFLQKRLNRFSLFFSEGSFMVL